MDGKVEDELKVVMCLVWHGSNEAPSGVEGLGWSTTVSTREANDGATRTSMKEGEDGDGGGSG